MSTVRDKRVRVTMPMAIVAAFVSFLAMVAGGAQDVPSGPIHAPYRGATAEEMANHAIDQAIAMDAVRAARGD